MDYVLVSLAALCIAGQFNVNKLYSKRAPKGTLWLLLFPAAVALATIIGFLALNGFRLRITTFGLLMAMGFGLVSALSNACGIMAVSKGSVGIYTTFMMLGGMLLPYLYGIIFLNEAVRVFHIIGVILLIAALFIPLMRNKKSEKQSLNKVFVFLCSFVFILNGLSSILTKVHQINANAMANYDFIILENMFVFVFVAIAAAIFCLTNAVKNKRNAASPESNAPQSAEQSPTEEAVKPKIWLLVLICVAFAVFSSAGYLLLLISASKLPASTLYPFTTGGSTILSTVIAAIIYKEKITLPIALSLTVMLAGTVLFIF